MNKAGHLHSEEPGTTQCVQFNSSHSTITGMFGSCVIPAFQTCIYDYIFMLCPPFIKLLVYRYMYQTLWGSGSRQRDM